MQQIFAEFVEIFPQILFALKLFYEIQTGHKYTIFTQMFNIVYIVKYTVVISTLSIVDS